MATPRLRAPLVLVALLATAACHDQGPDFASAVTPATDAIFASNGLILLSNTLDGTFAARGPGTPLPFFAKGAAGHVTAAQRALAILDRVLRAEELAAAPTGTPPAPFAAALTGPAGSAIPCPPTESGVDSLGDPIDSDGDGVPDDYTVTFDGSCGWLANGLVYNLSGKYRVRDTGTDLASFAFTATNLRETASDGSSTDHLSHTLNGTETATFAPAGAHHKLDFVLTYASSVSDTARTVTFTMSESSTFTPDPGSGLTAGGPLPAGTLDYLGDFRISGLAQSGNFRFILGTPVSLHYAPGCGNATGIDGGVFEGLLNGTLSKGFRYTWTVCNGPDPEYFGAN